MTIPLVVEKTLSDKASMQLTQAIITGELQQGQKLSEADLATRYGISRGPLREAIRQLEGMRLVKRVPHAGARVIKLDMTALANLYRVREALEGMACRMAAERMTEQEVSTLFDLLDAHEKQIEESGGESYFQSEGDFDFHFHIAQGSRNQMLIDLLVGELYQLLRMCRYQTSHQRNRTHMALKQHRQMVEAIADGDGDLAELLMRRHISGAWKSMKAMMDEKQ